MNRFINHSPILMCNVILQKWYKDTTSSLFLLMALLLVLLLTGSSSSGQVTTQPSGGQGSVTAPPVAPVPIRNVNSQQKFNQLNTNQRDITTRNQNKRGDFTVQTLPIEEKAEKDFNLAEIVVQIGHLQEINTIALTPDSKYLVSGSRDASLKLWDANLGKELYTFKEIKHEVNSMALSIDGKFLLTGESSLDKNVKLFDLTTLKLVKTFSKLEYFVEAVALTPDGKFAIACAENTIKVWDIESGNEVYTLNGHSGQIKALAVTHNSRFLVSGGDDKMVKIWDLETGKNIRTFTGHTESILGIVVGLNDKFIITCSPNDESRMWDLEQGTQVQSFANNGATSLFIPPDGKSVVFGCIENIQIWDIASCKKIRDVMVHAQGWIKTMTYNPLADGIISCGEENAIKQSDFKTGNLIWAASGKSKKISAVSVDKSGKNLLVGNESGLISIWDLTNGKQIKSITNHVGIQAIDFDQTGSKVFAGGWLFTDHFSGIKSFDVGNGNQIKEYKSSGSQWVKAMAPSDNGKDLIWASGNTIYISDILSGEVIHTYPNINKFEINHLEQKGKYAISSDRVTLQLWETETGRLINTFKGYNGTFSNDGTSLLLVGFDTSVAKFTMTVWDIATNAGNGVYFGEDERMVASLNDLAFSPDKKFAICSMYNEFHYWDVNEKRELFVSTGHTDLIHSVGFYGNGKYAYSGSDDGSVRLWNLEKGKELARLYSFTDGEWALITSDNHYNVSPKGSDYLIVRQGFAIYDILSAQKTFNNESIVKNTLEGKAILNEQKLDQVLDQYVPNIGSEARSVPHFGIGIIEIFVLLGLIIGLFLIIYFIRRR